MSPENRDVEWDDDADDWDDPDGVWEDDEPDDPDDETLTNAPRAFRTFVLLAFAWWMLYRGHEFYSVAAVLGFVFQDVCYAAISAYREANDA